MAKSSFLLTLAQISIVQIEQSESTSQRVSELPACKLKWRSNQLWVKAISLDLKSSHAAGDILPAIKNEQWLLQCLKHSGIARVCLDQNLGAAAIRQWAEVCEAAEKPVYVRLPAKQRSRLKLLSPPRWQQIVYQVFAALLLLVLAPCLLGIIGWRQLESSKPVFIRPWCIGRQGRLFRLIQFQTQTLNRTDDPVQLRRFFAWSRIPHWPELVNILRGEKGFGSSAALRLANLLCLASGDRSCETAQSSKPSQNESINSSLPQT